MGNPQPRTAEGAAIGLKRPHGKLKIFEQTIAKIAYRFDTQSFLNYYNKVFTNVALERITGINQKLLHHYATGLKKPREPQRKKIETTLHKLGSELLSLEL